MTALSVRQLVEYTLLLPQPIAALGVRDRVFSNFYEFFLAEKKLARFCLEFLVFCQKDRELISDHLCPVP